MEIFALIGPSGTGKSHRAAVVASNLGAEAIVDDGLLIQNNRIIAGVSAKRMPTRIGAIKAALFMNESKAIEIRQGLERIKPSKLLLLGTSEGMVNRIAQRLEIPLPSKIVRIEEIASEKEIRKARFHRNKHSKHVIPASTVEVKRSLPGILVDPLNIFLRKKEATGSKDWAEKSIVRPTHTYHGKLTIANSAIQSMVELTAKQTKELADTSNINVQVDPKGTISITIAITINYGAPIQTIAPRLQKHLKSTIEHMTGLHVKEVNIRIKGIRVEK